MTKASTTFTVTFRGPPGTAGIRGLRALLKTAWRRHRLRAVDLRETKDPHAVRPPRRAEPSLAAGEWKMALGKRKGQDFMPVLKYDARSGVFYLQDRVLGSDGWQNEQRDVTEKFHAVFDLEQVERGWIYYPKGAPPELVMVPAGADPGEAPSKDYKEGIRLVVKMPPELGGDVRELQSTAVAMWNAVDAVHTAFVNQAKDYPGQLPVVELTDIIESKTPNGTSFTPVLEIASWVPRPVDMPKHAAANCGPRKPARPAQAGDDFGNMDTEIPF
jgi:hypothetical protein